MNTLNRKLFLRPFSQTYNSINDIKFRKNLDGVIITENKSNANLVVSTLSSPLPPHFPKKLIVYAFIILLLITPTKNKNKDEYPK